LFTPEDPSGATYKESLLTPRDQLETLSLHPENPSADAGGALIELGVVESALQQMPTSETYQSCSSPIKSGVPSQVTVTWNRSPLGSGRELGVELQLGLRLAAHLEPDVRRRTLGADLHLASEDHRDHLGEEADPIDLARRPPDRADLVRAQRVMGDHVEAKIAPSECLDTFLRVS
jgi:hypothetical protein